MMKYYYMLPIFLLLFITACIPEPEPIDESPKAKGVYECFIDGEEFVANGPNFANQWSPNPHASYTELSGSMVFTIDNRKKDQSLYLYSEEIIKHSGKYAISSYTKFEEYSNLECDDYYFPDHKEYFLEITLLDIAHDIIVGSFEFELVNECRNDTIAVSGSFDLEYSL